MAERHRRPGPGGSREYGGAGDRDGLVHRGVERSRLRLVPALTALFMLAEVVGGLVEVGPADVQVVVGMGLHVWTLTSGSVGLSGHGVVDDPTRIHEVLEAVRRRVERRRIGHVTFQLEPRTPVRIEDRGGSS